MARKKSAEQKKILCININANLVEKVRDIVYWTREKSISGFIQEAISVLVEQREKQNGMPFKNRPKRQYRSFDDYLKTVLTPEEIIEIEKEARADIEKISPSNK